MRNDSPILRLLPAPSLSATDAAIRVHALSAIVESVGRSLAAGARMIEQQEGYPPGRLMFGGLIAWILCLGLMLVVANAAPVLRYATNCLALHCFG